MRYFIAVIILFFSVTTTAQQPTRAQLEQRRKQILATIQETENQLAATKQDTRATMGQLRAIQTKLKGRQRLIDNINTEIGQIGSSINKSNSEIKKLKENLGVLKMHYAQSVRYAYKGRSSYDMLAFLFSSDTFNEALRRMKYLKRYRDYRKDQADKIRLTQAKLQEELSNLNTEKAKKDILLNAEEQQKKAIEQDKQKTDEIIKELKGQEKELTAKIIKDRKVQQRIDKAVEDIIRKELEIARKKAAEEEKRRREEEERRRLLAEQQRQRQEEEERRRLAAIAAEKERAKTLAEAKRKADNNNSNIVVNNNAPKTVLPEPPPEEPPKPIAKPPVTKPVEKPTPTPPKNDYGLTPEAAALSLSFEANKGRLPWPVEKGFISLGFGPYKHPIAEKVTLDNYGVNISTSAGAIVRACFDGTVSKVFTMDGDKWNVLVNHGRYSTLYMNLAQVTVKANQKISTKQTIGKAAVNEDGESVINLQVWQETHKVDPAHWIAR